MRPAPRTPLRPSRPPRRGLGLAVGVAGLVLTGCVTLPEPAAPLRPIATYTFAQPLPVIGECFTHFIFGSHVRPEGDGYRLTVDGMAAHAIVWPSVGGTRAEVYEDRPTHAGVFKVGFEQCEAHLVSR